MYIVSSKVHHLNFGIIRCLFRYSRDAGYIKLIVEINLLLLRLLREISLSLLCSHSSWASALDLAPPLLVGHLRMSVPWLSSWLRCSGSLRQGGGRFTECGSTLRQQRSAWRCTSLRCGVCFPGEVVPGSRDPGSGWLHRLLGGEVWIVTCACTQASWWLQQQP